jgi:hypothetical protein
MKVGMSFCRRIFSAFRKKSQFEARRADYLFRLTTTLSTSKEKTMKTFKVLVLMAVVALGLAGTAKAAAQTGCCPSADCCADCSGCK